MALSLDQNGDGLVDSYYAFVEYVLDGTPAAEAGLQRGDWIVKIDVKNITDYTVLYGDDAHEFTLGIFTREYDAAGTLTGGYFDLKPSTELAPNPISMSTARAVEDYPVFKDTIVTSDGGKKVGYLAYNHFSRGVDDEADTDYDDQLRGLSRKFKTAGVEEFVLDLRYNNGGFLTCALLLSTMLAPEAAIGQEACSLVYNDKMSLKYDYSYNFMTQYLNQSPENPTGPKGENLNLPRLYVLTSGMTASASEMVINCLRPYYTVTLIGSQTEGKNVGSMPYDTSDGKWIMHPIVSRISNSAGFSDYSDGFPPDYELYEFYELQGGGAFPLDSRDIYPLGDPKERMFAAALTHIDTGSITRATTTRTLVPPSGRYKVIQNVSALRKPTNGVILDRNRGINH
jgi:C-terminal processing protease CtpA/Prc